MALFNLIKNQMLSQIKKGTSNAANNMEQNTSSAIAKSKDSTEVFTFPSLPANVSELKSLSEASLDSAFKTAALCIAVLCNLEKDATATWEMLDYLKGPENVNEREKAFIMERLLGKPYKVLSFFEGATPDNGYTPTTPYTIWVSENPYSFDEENWATLYVKSSGADAKRPIKLRRKLSTNQWFINEIPCLADIRVPASQDKWA